VGHEIEDPFGNRGADISTEGSDHAMERAEERRRDLAALLYKEKPPGIETGG